MNLPPAPGDTLVFTLGIFRKDNLSDGTITEQNHDHGTGKFGEEVSAILAPPRPPEALLRLMLGWRTDGPSSGGILVLRHGTSVLNLINGVDGCLFRSNGRHRIGRSLDGHERLAGKVEPLQVEEVWWRGGR